MSTFSKRLLAIKTKMTDRFLPDNHIVSVDIGQTEEQAKKQYKLKNKTEAEDTYMFIHLVNREMIEARKGTDNETKVYN